MKTVVGKVLPGTMDVEFVKHQFEDGHDGVVVKNSE